MPPAPVKPERPRPLGPPPSRPIVYLIALLGGLGGIVTAFVDQVSGMSWAAIAVAPAIEELCKPIAVIFMLERRPHWLRTQMDIMAMSLLGALVFASIENVLYIFVYHRDGGAAFIAWRLIVCTTLHLAATAIMAVGLTGIFRTIQREGGGLRLDHSVRYYAAAVGIHVAYNVTVILLETAGILEF